MKVSISLFTCIVLFSLAFMQHDARPSDLLSFVETILEPYEPKIMQLNDNEEMGNDDMGNDYMDNGDKEPKILSMMKDKSCPIKSGMGKYSYDESSMKGPKYWGKLSKEDEKCGTGKMQSPIDFPTDIRLSGMNCGAKINFMSGVMKFQMLINNWKFKCYTRGTCGWMRFLGKQYLLNNVHFHKPSEHRMNGVQFPLEMNLEYTSSDKNRMIVVVILFRFEEETSFLEQTTSRPLFDNGQQPLIQNLLDAVKMGNSTTVVDISTVLDPKRGFCAYMGSFTRPPCQEGVTYLMSMHTPVVSKRQVHEFWVSTGFTYEGNSRPLQPLNSREVTCYLG